MLIEYPDPDERRGSSAGCAASRTAAGCRSPATTRCSPLPTRTWSARPTRRPRRCTSCASSSPRRWSGALRGGAALSAGIDHPAYHCASRARAGRFAPLAARRSRLRIRAPALGGSALVQRDGADVYRFRHRSPLRPGARASPPGHVHRHHAPESPGARGHRQQRRRGARRPLQDHRRQAVQGRLAARSPTTAAACRWTSTRRRRSAASS